MTPGHLILIYETQPTAAFRRVQLTGRALHLHVALLVLNLNSVNQLMFVMVKCSVLIEVRTGFLNNI
jgi:hypothetical protein